MKRIALINDLSSLGNCSLMAAIPVVSTMGIQAVPLPTAILSAQTGFSSYYYDDYTSKMNKFTENWLSMNETFEGISSGFLMNVEQISLVNNFLNHFHTDNNLYLADPILGDHGKRFPFFTDELLAAIKSLTLRADIITPNLTELSLLTNKDYEGLTSNELITTAARTLIDESDRLKYVIVTGILSQNGSQTMIGNLAITKSDVYYVQTPYTGVGFSGTGDLFASVIIGCLVNGQYIESAMKKAVAFLQPAIEEATKKGTPRNYGVPFVNYLHLL